MALISRKTPAFDGVQAGATATVNLPLVLTYYGILINLNDNGASNALDLSKFTALRVKGDGRELYNIEPATLDKFNQHDNLPPCDTAASGKHLLYLPFIRHRMLSWEMQTYTVIGAGMPQNLDANDRANFNPFPLQTLQLEIDIAASASSPSISAIAIQGGRSVLGNILKRRKFTYSATGTGRYEISDLPKGDLIDRIWVSNAASIKDMTLERDNFVSFERTRDQNLFLQEAGVRGPKFLDGGDLGAIANPAAVTAAGIGTWANGALADAVDAQKKSLGARGVFDEYFVLDPCEFGFGREPWVTNDVQDFRLILNTSANIASLQVYVDYIGGVRGN